MNESKKNPHSARAASPREESWAFSHINESIEPNWSMRSEVKPDSGKTYRGFPQHVLDKLDGKRIR